MIMKETKEAAEQWVKDGKPCTYRRGLAYRGATARKISNEEALQLLPKYSFGMGFYSLSYSKFEDEPVLEFNEFNENDLF